MNNFSDRLIAQIKRKGNPCVVGLDPRIPSMPECFTEALRSSQSAQSIRKTICDFHEAVLDAVCELVPAVKAQSAFYEQYGLGGIGALADTIRMAKERNLLVILDAKRNDIASTAEAYANAYLGKPKLVGKEISDFEVDCMTVSPFLGRDSLDPFVKACKEHGKGIFILVKTSNLGSKDLQDLKVSGSEDLIYARLAQMVKELATADIGDSGYSSIGAVVGATFPSEATMLRSMMPKSIFLVPGYGAQGGSAADAGRCFNADGLGAVVNASRSITYPFKRLDVPETECRRVIKERCGEMVKDITTALSRLGK